MLEHPDIGWIERTGYPSCIQDRVDMYPDEDSAYEETRERALFGD